MNVLSIQSSVAAGHVGNTAAEMPLALAGHEVWRVDTVQFSNHPGHGRHRGGVVAAEALRALLGGLAELGLGARTDAILSGYLGSAANGDAVADHVASVRAANPATLYLLDPVMGDARPGEDGGSLYVDPAIPAIMRTRLLPLADIVTPNRFELEVLTGRSARSLAAICDAAADVLAAGPKLVVVTSVDGVETPSDAIDLLAISAAETWRVRHRRHPRRFDGAGDCLTALFLGNLLNRLPVGQALAAAASSLLPVLDATERSGGLDLALIPCLPRLFDPPERLVAERLLGSDRFKLTQLEP